MADVWQDWHRREPRGRQEFRHTRVACFSRSITTSGRRAGGERCTTQTRLPHAHARVSSRRVLARQYRHPSEFHARLEKKTFWDSPTTSMPTALMSARRRSLSSVRGQSDVAASDTNGSLPDGAEEDLGEPITPIYTREVSKAAVPRLAHRSAAGVEWRACGRSVKTCSIFYGRFECSTSAFLRIAERRIPEHARHTPHTHGPRPSVCDSWTLYKLDQDVTLLCTATTHCRFSSEPLALSNVRLTPDVWVKWGSLIQP